MSVPDTIQPHDHFPEALAHILRHEGGYVDHPSDPGGASKYGMSLRTLRAQGDADLDGVLDWDLDKDGDIDAADIRALTPEHAAAYYRKRWWDRYGLGLIRSAPVAVKIMDMAVNIGARRAVLIAQQAACGCGRPVTLDGVLGPVTAAALDACPVDDVRHRVCRLQRAFYRDLIEDRPRLAVFERGWMTRAAFWPEED